MKRIAHVFTLFICLLLPAFVFAQEAEVKETPASIYNDALADLKEQNYSEALPKLEKALEMADPENENDAKVIDLAKKNGAIACYYVGTELRKENKFDEALARYEQGISYGEDFYANFLGKAQTLEAAGSTQEAAAAYVVAGQMAIQAGKAESGEKYISKGETFAAKAVVDEDWDNAIAYGEAVLENKKDSDRAHYSIARGYQGKGELSKAVEHYDAAIAVNNAEENGKYYYYKGEALAQMGNKEAAIKAYKMVDDANYKQRADYNIKQLQQ